MHGFENQRIFHADSHQVVDGKKSPVVDFVVGGEPVRQHVSLHGQQPVKQHKALGLPLAAIEEAHIVIDEIPHLGRLLIQLPEPFLDGLPLHASFPGHLRGKRDAVGKVGHGGANPSQFPVGRMLGTQLALQLVNLMVQNEKVGLGRDGQLGIVILDEEAALLVEQPELLILQRLGVGAAKDR